MGRVYRATATDVSAAALKLVGEPVTGASDVYSLGYMVFECPTGHPPSADRQGMRVLWAHLEDDPPDPCAERPDIRPDFARAVNATLAKQPGGRPRTSVEYARSFALAAGIPIGDVST